MMGYSNVHVRFEREQNVFSPRSSEPSDAASCTGLLAAPCEVPYMLQQQHRRCQMTGLQQHQCCCHTIAMVSGAPQEGHVHVECLPLGSRASGLLRSGPDGRRDGD